MGFFYEPIMGFPGVAILFGMAIGFMILGIITFRSESNFSLSFSGVYGISMLILTIIGVLGVYAWYILKSRSGEEFTIALVLLMLYILLGWVIWKRSNRKIQWRRLSADLVFSIWDSNSNSLENGTKVLCVGGEPIILTGEVNAGGEVDLIEFTTYIDTLPSVQASPPQVIKRLTHEKQKLTIQLLPRVVGVSPLGIRFSWRHPITKSTRTLEFQISLIVEPGLRIKILPLQTEIMVGNPFPVRVELNAYLDTNIAEYQLVDLEGFKVLKVPQFPTKLQTGSEWTDFYELEPQIFGEHSLLLEISTNNYTIKSESKQFQVLPKRPKLFVSIPERVKEIELGAEICLPINFSNEGEGDAANVRLSKNLPSVLDIIDDKELKIPIIKSGESLTRNLIFKSSTPGDIEISELLIEFEDLMGNSFHYRLAGWTIRAIKKIPKINLTVKPPSNIQVGQPFAVTLLIQNTGEGAAYNTVVNITVPTGLQLMQGKRQYQFRTINIKDPSVELKPMFLAQKSGNYVFDNITAIYTDFDKQNYQENVSTIPISVVEPSVEQRGEQRSLIDTEPVKNRSPTIPSKIQEIEEEHPINASQDLEIDKHILCINCEKRFSYDLNKQPITCPNCKRLHNVCPVCKKPIGFPDEHHKDPVLCYTGCGTMFHRHHLIESLQSSGICPICRKELRVSFYRIKKDDIRHLELKYTTQIGLENLTSINQILTDNRKKLDALVNFLDQIETAALPQKELERILESIEVLKTDYLEEIVRILNKRSSKLNDLRKTLYRELQRKGIGSVWDAFQDEFQDLADASELFNKPNVAGLGQYFGKLKNIVVKISTWTGDQSLKHQALKHIANVWKAIIFVFPFT